MKLLALPRERKAKGGEEKVPNNRDALREQSMAARRQLRLTPVEVQQRLLEVYGKLKEEAE